MGPLTVAKAALAALRKTVSAYYYRGDAGCHEKEWLRWLSDERREEGPQGCIGFAISVRMSEALREGILEVPEKEWKAYGEPEPGVERECAEVVFVWNQQTEPKDSQPLRYIAILLRQRQGGLSADGRSVRHFAVLSNLWDWEPVKLIEWHREKAGTIERVHDVMKNDLAAGVLPSKYFGANAAWLRLAVITYNVLTAPKRFALPADLLTAPPKQLRFLIFPMSRRLVHHSRQLSFRLATDTHGAAPCLDTVRDNPPAQVALAFDSDKGEDSLSERPWSSTAPPGEFRTYISAEESPKEFTIRAVILGALFGLLFGAVTVYVGLRAGLTVSASIPISALSTTLPRPFARSPFPEHHIAHTTR